MSSNTDERGMKESKAKKHSLSHGQRNGIILLILTVGMFSAVAVSFYAKNEIRILRPMLSVPAIITSSGSFMVEIEAKYSFDLHSIKLSLESPYGAFPLSISALDFQEKKIAMTVTCPASILPDVLYDFRVEINGLIAFQANAVKVISAFKHDFQIAIWSDPQIDMFDTMDPKLTIPHMEAVIQDLNLIQPELVIVTGDISEWARPDEYQKFYDTLAEKLDIPAYIVVGNHDKYTPSEFLRLFGHYTYEFDYGSDHHFTIIDSSINLDGISDETYEFLISDLQKHKDFPHKYIAMHSPPFIRGINRNFENHRVDFLQTCEEYNVDAVYFGHEHEDGVFDIEGNPLPFNKTGYDGPIFMMTNDGREEAAYRLITLKNDDIWSYTIQNGTNSFDDMISPTAGNLMVTCSGANDGTLSALTALIQNRFLYQGFDGIEISFMINSPGGAGVLISTNATWSLIIFNAPFIANTDIRSVKLLIPLPANRSVVITITGA